MKADGNRPGRIERARRERANGKRLRRHAGWNAAAIACAAIAFATSPAQGATGGVAATDSGSTAAAAQAEGGEGIAFTPMRWAGATWYGPGLYGNQTACGQILRPGTVGVAHRSLPCGTPVKFVYRGRQIVTRVIDRGPYAAGKVWDLTNGARRALGFEGTDRVLYGVALSHARQSRR